MKIKRISTILNKLFSSRRRKVVSLFIIVLIIIFVITLLVFLINKDNKKDDSSNLPQTKAEISDFNGGSGGDPKLVLDYYNKAMDSYKAGKKDEAKLLAEKAIEEKDKLTLEQQNELPRKSEISYNLYDITKGTYNDFAE